MDGLMLDTEPIYKTAWQSGCRELGYDLDDVAYSRLVGRPTSACEQILLETLGPEFPLERFRQLWPSIWQAEVSSRGIRQKPGLAALLAFLRSRNVPTAVATSSELTFTEVSLSQANLSGFFQAIVTGDQIERGKPAPDSQHRRHCHTACPGLGGAIAGRPSCRRRGVSFSGRSPCVH
jgi:beta-phosphoglucomutase-like phosphatase (HAD superfamily)